MTRTTVSIVNWNGVEDLRACLLALRSATGGGTRIAVIDNASSDGSAEMVTREFPDVELHALSENLGFAGGNNLVLRTLSSDYVLILNPDVEVAPDSLHRLLDFLDRTPAAAAASPILIGRDDRPQTHLYRRFPSVAQLVLFWTVLGVIAKRIPTLRRRFFEHDLRGEDPISADQLPGAAMLIRGSALEAVGEWDPAYFIWFEDVDWCYRARSAGYDLYVLPDARFRHEGGSSFRSWNLERRLFQFYRAFFRFLCKHRLTRLRAFALPVLLTDLQLKGLILRFGAAAGFVTAEDATAPRSTRRAIKDVVRRCDRGEVVVFADAGSAASPGRVTSKT